ncbi:MAG: CsgG/HfaB family protein, partial [Gemmatimonadetes bacterium]|nr:CsgG/HfaB family protein [Gemmatimonadota bacterium]
MSVRFRPGHLLLACLAVAACATGLPRAEPADIPMLRERLAAAPGDADVLTRLGIALYKDAQHAEAARVLDEAVAAGATGGAAHLYLGLAHEEMGQWSEARAAYAGFLDAGGSGALQSDIRGRMALMGRRELEAAAQQALAQEASLSSEPPAPRSVAVFPFRLVSENLELEPLQVALADMMITDLTLAGDLTVLERAQIQTLLNEMALTEAGYTEPATG